MGTDTGDLGLERYSLGWDDRDEERWCGDLDEVLDGLLVAALLSVLVADAVDTGVLTTKIPRTTLSSIVCGNPGPVGK